MDYLARGGADLAQLVADFGSIKASGGLGCKGDGNYGVVGFLRVGHVGEIAVLVDEGAIPGSGGFALWGGFASGAVHSGEVFRADELDEAEPLGGVAEGEIVVEAAVDGFLDEGECDGLEGDDDEGLGVVGGAFLKLGQEGVLVEFDRDGADLAGPGLLESLGEALTPGVVLIYEANVVEALVAVYLGKDRPLGAI